MGLYLIIFIILLRFAPFPFLGVCESAWRSAECIDTSVVRTFLKTRTTGTWYLSVCQCCVQSVSFNFLFFHNKFHNSLYSCGNGKICIKVSAGSQGLGRCSDTGYCIWAYFASSFCYISGSNNATLHSYHSLPPILV